MTDERPPKNEEAQRETYVGLLERAIQIAAEAHAGQRDKSGEPYVLHPLRMLGKAKSLEVQIVAVLHDVIEDCPAWTPKRLKQEGFPRLLLDALALVTKTPSEESDKENGYETFVRRIRAGKGTAGRIARAVKRLDLEDNMDLRRLQEFSDKDSKRMARYLWAYHFLGFEED